MKTVKVILKIGGCVMILIGVGCLIAGYMEQLKALVSRKPKEEELVEFADYADVEQ